MEARESCQLCKGVNTEPKEPEGGRNNGSPHCQEFSQELQKLMIIQESCVVKSIAISSM